MKKLLLLLPLMGPLACASTQAARCTALRAELLSATESCDSCLERLAAHGDASVCGDVCQSPSTTAPAALSACAAAGPAPSAPTAPSAPPSASAELAPDIE